MLTPEEIDKLVETMQPLIDELNDFITMDIIKRLMARIRHGDPFKLSESDIWQIEVLRETNAHFRTVQQKIVTWTGKAEREIAAIFEDAGITAWNADRKIYEANGRTTLAINELPRMVQIMQDTMQRTFGTFHNLTRTTAHSSQQRFIRLLDEAHMKTITGATSYQEAVRQAVNELCTKQLVVTYGDAPNGQFVHHKDTIEVATLRAVRTGTAQACGNISLQGMIDNDYDIIQVSGHLGARYGDGGENPGNHFWWQAKLYSRTGKTPNIPNFAVCGYGSGEGLCGWNCRHSFGPGTLGFNPYEGFDSEENKKAYDLSQKQRALERRIRRDKADVVGRDTALKYCPEEEKEKYQADYDKSVALLKKHMKAYNDFCKANKLKKQYDRLEHAKYTRLMRNSKPANGGQGAQT